MGVGEGGSRHVQVPRHGEQHVRGFADPQLWLLNEVHLPVLPLLLLLLLLGVLKPRNHLASYTRCLNPTSARFGQVRANENSVQELRRRRKLYKQQASTTKVSIDPERAN